VKAMNKREMRYRQLGRLTAHTRDLAGKCVEETKDHWDRIDQIVFANQDKVLKAFTENKICLFHMNPSSGYGYGDVGRDALERLYASVFGGEQALVRTHWTSGTHVIKSTLFAILRPGDQLLCVTGSPYDTLLPVIGCGEGKRYPGSLAEFGVTYKQTDCLLKLESQEINVDEMAACLKELIEPMTKAVFVQRSRGYAQRKSVSLKSLAVFLEILKEKWPGIYTVVDNCYSEFTGVKEPPEVGADLTVGSLIKNPGGGLALTGGYAVGSKKCVEMVADSLYAPGLAGEVGSNPAGYRDVFQGLFLAPKVVGEALKGAVFASLLFQALGYRVDPCPGDERSDIVQSIILGDPRRLSAVTGAIQAASPVDSYVLPQPWDMPGYDHKVIMAAGGFVQGSSIELSCDAPFIPPFAAYLQGGLTKEHVILACMNAKEALENLQ
jgi:cystathionine beta-lyase family protein involved in aluminum resistance